MSGLILPYRAQAFDASTGQVTARQFVKASSQRIAGAATATAVPITIAAWVRITSSQAGTAVGIYQTAAPANGFYIGFSATTLTPYAASVANNTYRVAQGSTGASQNVWHHLAGVFASSTSRKVYVDGTEVGSETTASTPVGLNNTNIAAFATNGTVVYGDLDIAAVGIWGTTLNASQIAELATGIREDNSSAGVPLSGWRQRDGGLLTPYCGSAQQTLTAYNSPTEVSDGPVLYL